MIASSKLQKKSIRAINSLSYNSHTNDYFKSMEILKVEDLAKWRSLTYIFKSENISTTAEIHAYNTRNRDSLSIPRYNRSRTQSTIFYQGILRWNALPMDIRALEHIGAFNNATKKLLFSFPIFNTNIALIPKRKKIESCGCRIYLDNLILSTKLI